MLGFGGGGLESRLGWVEVGGGTGREVLGGEGVLAAGGGLVNTVGFFGIGGFLAEAVLLDIGDGGIGEFIVIESCCSCDCMRAAVVSVLVGGGARGFLKVCVEESVVLPVSSG